MGWAKRLKEMFSQKNSPEQPQRPAIENPYRRFYSQDCSFEDLVRRARENAPDAKDPEK